MSDISDAGRLSDIVEGMLSGDVERQPQLLTAHERGEIGAVLQKFRESIESDAGLALDELRWLDPALLLDDLCAFIGLNDTQRVLVLTDRGVAYCDRFAGERPALPAASIVVDADDEVPL